MFHFQNGIFFQKIYLCPEVRNCIAYNLSASQLDKLLNSSASWLQDVMYGGYRCIRKLATCGCQR